VPVRLDDSGAVPGRIGLRVARLDMGGPASRPLIYLAGGPGDAGVEELLDVVDSCRGVSADPEADLGALRARPRAAPLRGAVYDADGRRSERALTPLALSDLLFDADDAPASRRGCALRSTATRRRCCA
jgi:hypothetical protein